MWLHVVAVEFTVSRPETTAGWIALAFVTVVVVWIIARGSASILDKALDNLLGPLLGLVVVLGALVLFNMVYSDEDNDPLTRGEIEVFPNRTPAGSKIEVHPELDNHLDHDYDGYGGYED
jgi:predicted transporter